MRNRYPDILLQINFWSSVDRSLGNDVCWPWTGNRFIKAQGKLDYGICHRFRGTQLSHRASWMIFNGPIPKGLYVLHKCDNPPCCNPRHLFLGTPRDNVVDMYSKGRGYPHQGERHGMAKLNPDDVKNIKKLVLEGHPHVEIASIYGVSRSNIGAIVNGRSWSHLKND